MLTEVFTQPPTIEQIEGAVNKLTEQANFGGYSRHKFLVKFSVPSRIIKARRNVEGISQMNVRTFKAKDGDLCYTFGSRRGWPFHLINYHNIRSISTEEVKEVEDRVSMKKLTNIQKALRLIHPNAWDDLKQDLIDKPDNYKYHGGFLKLVRNTKFTCQRQDGTSYRMTKSIFGEWVIKQLEEAFQNKTKFSAEESNRQYSFRISCEVGTNGIFRAWYTREVKGGGANWAYLLLNPTTAWFVEKD